MSERGGENSHMDPADWSQAMARIAEQSQRLVGEFVQRNQFNNAQGMDPMAIGRAFMEMTTRLMSDPADASDIVPEVFLKVFRNIGKFR